MQKTELSQKLDLEHINRQRPQTSAQSELNANFFDQTSPQ